MLNEPIPIFKNRRFWHALMIFGHGLTIPEAEEGILADLVMPAVVAASLTNDLFSFEKEYHASKKAGKMDFANGIWVLMKEHKIPIDQAKDFCRKLIKESVENFVLVLSESSMRESLSTDAKRYIELIQYSVSGNVIWSSECPRYHKATQKGFFEIPQYPEEIFGDRGQIKHQRVNSLPPSPEPTASRASASREQSAHKKRRTTAESWEDIPLSARADTSSENEHLRILPVDPLDSSMMISFLPGLSDHVAMEPFRYISNLPSKGVREKAIDALNFWLEVPPEEVDVIKSVVSMMHNSSLLLDDLQDHSPLRRGKPSTHIIYGMEQTVNSATMLFVDAVIQLQKLNCPRILRIFTEDVRKLFIGQSYDILWTRELLCPTVTEYLQMVDGKTGGLFRLLTRLLRSRSPHQIKFDFDKLVFLFGRYFQIRDDYQNLTALDYTNQKGYCEDLDEGKYSLPLIHALHCTSRGMLLRGLLQRRKVEGKLTREQKDLILFELRATGSFEYTLRTLRSLHAEIDSEIKRLERTIGKDNFELRLLLNVLQI
jgi:geranylgeranyl pyrophosphate synthase